MDTPIDVSMLQGGRFQIQTYPIARATCVNLQPLGNVSGTPVRTPWTVFCSVIGVMMAVGVGSFIVGIVMYVLLMSASLVGPPSTTCAYVLLFSWAGLTLLSGVAALVYDLLN